MAETEEIKHFGDFKTDSRWLTEDYFNKAIFKCLHKGSKQLFQAFKTAKKFNLVRKCEKRSTYKNME